MPDPDSLPTSDDLAGPCPRCGRVSSFVQSGRVSLRAMAVPRVNARGSVELERASALSCQGCGDATLVIETRPSPEGPYTAVLWWPVPGAGQLDASVPALVAEPYDEGIRCIAVQAPHASVVMFRSALAQIVLDKGTPDAKAKVVKNLNDGVQQWIKDGGLHESLADWATHARGIGNAGAHPEAYLPVTMEDAADLQALVRQVLQVLYVVPANIARARAQGSGAKRP